METFSKYSNKCWDMAASRPSSLDTLSNQSTFCFLSANSIHNDEHTLSFAEVDLEIIIPER